MVKELLIAGPLVKILENNPLFLDIKIIHPKIFHLAQKMREEMYFKVNTSDPYIAQIWTSQTDGHTLKTACLLIFLNSLLASRITNGFISRQLSTCSFALTSPAKKQPSPLSLGSLLQSIS